jgi:uncharacterized protein
VFARLRAGDGRLLHRLRGADAGIPGFLEDYAFVVWGLIDLYEATFETTYLRHAVDLTDDMLELFHDETDGGLYFTAADAEELIVRVKEAHDGALPSGNAVAACNLLRLARMTGRIEYEKRAELIIEAFGAQVERHPTGHTVMLTALHFAQSPGHEIVLTGPDRQSVADMARALRTRWLPQSVFLFRGGERTGEIDELAPFVSSYRPVDGKAAAYVCRGFACELPVTSVDEMIQLLERT